MSPGIWEIDIHNLNQYQAQVRIESLLRRADRAVYILRIIHGYNQGTALKDMIRAQFSGHPKVKRIAPGSNPGVTDLILREL